MLHTSAAFLAITAGIWCLRARRDTAVGTLAGLLLLYAGGLILVSETSWMAGTRWLPLWLIPAWSLRAPVFALGCVLVACAMMLDAGGTWIAHATPLAQAATGVVVTGVLVAAPRTAVGARLGLTLIRGALVVGATVGAVILGQAAAPDGLPGLVGSMTWWDDTRFAAGYTDAAFERVQPGMTHEDVRALLGIPLEAYFAYDNPRCRMWLADGALRTSADERWQSPCGGVQIRASAEVAYRKLGMPSEETWMFSVANSDSNFRERIVRFRNGRVVSRIADLYVE